MAIFNKFQPFIEALAEGKHDLGSDTLKIALCNSSNAPVAGDAVLADLTEIAYTNLSSRDLVVASSAQTAGIYKLVFNDLVLSASGGTVATFRYIVIYNDTATSDELVGFYDKGQDVSLTDGDEITLDFSPTNGVLQIG